MCLQVSFPLYLNQSKLKLSRTPGVLILFLKGELCTAVIGSPPFLKNRFFFLYYLLVVMNCRVRWRPSPEPRMVTELIIWQKKSEFKFGVFIYFLLLRYAVLFTTSFSPQNSYVRSFVLLTNLWQDCESKIIYLLGEQKGARTRIATLWINLYK